VKGPYARKLLPGRTRTQRTDCSTRPLMQPAINSIIFGWIANDAAPLLGLLDMGKSRRRQQLGTVTVIRYYKVSVCWCSCQNSHAQTPTHTHTHTPFGNESLLAQTDRATRHVSQNLANCINKLCNKFATHRSN